MLKRLISDVESLLRDDGKIKLNWTLSWLRLHEVGEMYINEMRDGPGQGRDAILARNLCLRPSNVFLLRQCFSVAR